MKLEFSFYELVGVLVPGFVMLFIVSTTVPSVGEVLGSNSMSAGDFGFLLFLGYAVGHLIQSFGNFFEWFFWKVLGGRPTSWIVTKKRAKILNESQAEKFKTAMEAKGFWPKGAFPENYLADEWDPVVRQIFALVRCAGNGKRCEIFNGNYGLFRGLASAFVLGAAAIIIDSGFQHGAYLGLLAFGFFLSAARMYRFGKYYARELYVQYLNCVE